MSSNVDVVVPVYNDPENFQTLYETLSKKVQSAWRLLLVYDMPEDTTLSVAQLLAEKDARVVLVRNSSRGVLSAIKTGFARAEAPATLLLMVDDPPEVIEKIDSMIGKMEENNAAVVAASRYMKGGSHTGGNPLKGFLSRMAGLSLHYVINLPIHDATYATKLFRTSFLKKTPIESTRGFTYALELSLKAYIQGEPLAEVPVAWRERTSGTSRFAFFGWLGSYLYWYFWGIFHVLFRSRK
ncbi:glycosyltransferase family 2 protein [Candidatus Parcubacteria bacterium]|nr:MAG: glycosyltransferase family 2 protein [Candidatus Parcubacteria bacterium]